MPDLYHYTLDIIREQHHESSLLPMIFTTQDGAPEAKAIQTFYEKKFRKEGIPIKYLEFRLNHG